MNCADITAHECCTLDVRMMPDADSLLHRRDQNMPKIYLSTDEEAYRKQSVGPTYVHTSAA